MAYLVNRVPAARFQCLHSLCKFINSEYSTKTSFTLNEIKFKADGPNIHSFCDYLKRNDNLDISHCRFKPAIDKSGCGLTNSITSDSTKSKEVSNTINSLHGLGLVTRDINGKVTLSKLGKNFAETEFYSESMHPIIVEAALNYGPVIGMLGQILQSNLTSFNTNDISVGYPVTNERVLHNGSRVVISSGSEQDSNTRTRSSLIAWGISSGFFRLEDSGDYKASRAHIESADYILSETRGKKKLKLLKIPKLLDNKFCTNRTLDYSNLTKNSKALRESNQLDVREATMYATTKIQNRRFAILYLLNNCYRNNTTITLDEIVEFLKIRQDLYVINLQELKKVVTIEINIANSAGIILERSGSSLRPMNLINLKELEIGAPDNLLKDIKERVA